MKSPNNVEIYISSGVVDIADRPCGGCRDIPPPMALARLCRSDAHFRTRKKLANEGPDRSKCYRQSRYIKSLQGSDFIKGGTGASQAFGLMRLP